jgi:hypothetical protein
VSGVRILKPDMKPDTLVPIDSYPQLVYNPQSSRAIQRDARLACC